VGTTNLEESLGVLGVELEKLSGGTSDLGEGKLNSPDLPLVPETVLSSELEGGKTGESEESERRREGVEESRFFDKGKDEEQAECQNARTRKWKGLRRDWCGPVEAT
jgi:hypothetical protein